MREREREREGGGGWGAVLLSLAALGEHCEIWQHSNLLAEPPKNKTKTQTGLVLSV